MTLMARSRSPSCQKQFSCLGCLVILTGQGDIQEFCLLLPPSQLLDSSPGALTYPTCSLEQVLYCTNTDTNTDITGVRSWFGLVNQVAYSFCMTRQMEPFRSLLKPAQIFQWDEHLEEAFVRSKKEIVKAVEEGVRIFDMNRTTCLALDWCKSGVGFFLLQKYCSCTDVTPRCCPEGWKLVFAGARWAPTPYHDMHRKQEKRYRSQG